MSAPSVTVPIWSFAKRVDRRGREDSELLSVYRDHGVVPKSSRDDNFNKESEDLSNYLHVQQGDLVLNKMKTWQGSLAVSKFEGIVSPAYFVCQLSPQVEPRFIHYLLRSEPLIAEYAKRSKGIRPNQWDLPFDEFKAIEVALPPVEEQRRIADFLDDQAGQIDSAIAERGRQKDLIHEIRDASISTVLLASSEPIPLKHLTSKIGSGKTPRGGSDAYTDSGVIFLRSQNVHDDGIHLDDVAYIDRDTDAEMSGTRVCQGDVLLNITGGSLGRVAVVPSAFPRANVSQHVCIVRPKPGIDPYVIAASLRTTEVQQQIDSLQVGGNREGLNFEQVGGLSVRVPLTGGQPDVAGLVRSAQELGGSIAALLADSVRLLEERKRSLITAAVTGEMDVTTARPINMGKWVPNVGASAETPAAAQASGIGGIG